MAIIKVVKNITTKWLGLLILAIMFLSLNYNEETLFFDKTVQEELSVPIEFLKKEFPRFNKSSGSKELKGWSVIKDKLGKTVGYYTISENNRWNYTGYAGDVPIFIKLDKEKKISAIKMLQNRETPRFLYRLYNRNFMEKWNGKTLLEASVSKIDAVAGVTLTSQTIIANLSEALIQTDLETNMGEINNKKFIITIAQLILILFAIASFFIQNLKRYRIWFTISNVVVFGFIAGNFISITMIKGFFTGSVSFSQNPILWVMLIISLILPLITNKSFYCNYVCPFGAVQELIGKLPFKAKLPIKLTNILTNIRPVLFGLITILIVIDYTIDLSLVEPFAAFLYSVAAPITILLAVTSLVLSIIFNKPWCKWFCPTGQLFEYLRSDK